MATSSEPDKVREAALEAAVNDLGETSTVEEVAAALEAIRQVPIDLDRMLNAIRVPDDAGEYEAHSVPSWDESPTGGVGGSPVAPAGTPFWPAWRHA